MTSLLQAFLKADWAAFEAQGWPSPEGLILGLRWVLIGHALVVAYYMFRRFILHSTIAYNRPPVTGFFPTQLFQHLAQPEGIIMVFSYLTGIWMFRFCPDSYYTLNTSIHWVNVLMYFLLVDFGIYWMHYLEHLFPSLYKVTHAHHHTFVSPILFNAFQGSLWDTFNLIVVPLFTAMKVLPLLGFHLTNRDFAVFGAIYANQFMLLHMEFRNPWDSFLEWISVGTGYDHMVHHALFNYNYGHFFMIYDKVFGTYRAPSSVPNLKTS